MAIKIEAATRQVLYEAATTDLSGIGDLMIELDAGRVLEAQLLRQRFEDELRLLDDLGWETVDDRQEFGLTMPVEQLTRMLGTFYDRQMCLLLDNASTGTAAAAKRDSECLSALRDLSLAVVATA